MHIELTEADEQRETMVFKRAEITAHQYEQAAENRLQRARQIAGNIEYRRWAGQPNVRCHDDGVLEVINS